MGTRAGPGWDRGLCLAWGRHREGNPRGGGGGVTSGSRGPEEGVEDEDWNFLSAHPVEPAAWQGHLGKCTLARWPPQPPTQMPLETSAFPQHCLFTAHAWSSPYHLPPRQGPSHSKPLLWMLP